MNDATRRRLNLAHMGKERPSYAARHALNTKKEQSMFNRSLRAMLYRHTVVYTLAIALIAYHYYMEG